MDELRKYDVIQYVNDEDVRKWSYTQFVDFVKQLPSTMRLRLLRDPDAEKNWNELRPRTVGEKLSSLLGQTAPVRSPLDMEMTSAVAAIPAPATLDAADWESPTDDRLPGAGDEPTALQRPRPDALDTSKIELDVSSPAAVDAAASGMPHSLVSPIKLTSPTKHPGTPGSADVRSPTSVSSVNSATPFM